MKDENKTKERLIQELKKMREKIVDLEEITIKEKRTKKKLKEPEKKYKDLVEEAPLGIANIGVTGKIIYINKRLEKISGYSREEVVGKNVFKLDVFPDEMLKILKERLKVRLREGSTHQRREGRFKHKDGKWIWIEITTKLIKKWGMPASFRITVQDITERKQAERSEKQLLTEMGFLYKTALDFIQFDPKNDIYQFIGKKLKKIVGDSIVLINSYDKASDSFRVRALEGVREKIKKALKIIGKDFFTMSFPVNNEVARSQLISSELLKIPGGLYELSFGQIPRSICHVLEKFFNVGEIYFSGFAREKELFGNIIIIMPKGVELNNREFINTFIKQAAIALQSKQAEEELNDSEERLKILFDYAPDAYYIVDLKGKFIDGNKAAERMVGYKKEELIGKSIFKLKLISISDISKVAKLLAKNIRGLPTGPSEFVLNRKDNRKVIVESSTYPVKIKGRTLVLGLARDVTKRKQAEREVKQGYEKLQKTMEATINTISKIVETRDPYTAGHQNKVSQLAVAIAQEMKLPEDKIEGIRIAALVHDLGKISIPAEILSKPSKLNEMEFSLIKDHPKIGYDILKSIEFPWPVAKIVLQHHEKIDGSGYPQSLKGDDILLEAKIIGVADVVEAMSSHRPYRPALGIDAALNEIIKNKGILYDPEVVDICIKLFKEKGFKF